VRRRAASALGKLIPLQPRLDSLFTELNTGIKVRPRSVSTPSTLCAAGSQCISSLTKVVCVPVVQASDGVVREAFLRALASVLKEAGASVTAAVKSTLSTTLLGLLSDADGTVASVVAASHGPFQLADNILAVQRRGPKPQTRSASPRPTASARCWPACPATSCWCLSRTAKLACALDSLLPSH